MALAQQRSRSIPQRAACLQGQTRRFARVLQPVRGADQRFFDQHLGGWAVGIPIQLDVPLQVINEARRLLHIQSPVLQQTLEHVGNDVFAAVEETGHHFQSAAVQAGIDGVPDEIANELRHFRRFERRRQPSPTAQFTHECVELFGRSADIAHRLEIKVQMAGRMTVGIDVAFFSEHDVVDQTGGGGIDRRHPRQFDAGKIALQSFGQRHEIPDCKYMHLHEGTQGFGMRDFGEDRVDFQFVTQAAHGLGQNHIVLFCGRFLLHYDLLGRALWLGENRERPNETILGPFRPHGAGFRRIRVPAERTPERSSRERYILVSPNLCVSR